MKLKFYLAAALFAATVLPSRLLLAEHGSTTIDRIADIKYPNDQARSPDGKTVAFLWDAAGKHDLYMVRPGEKPVASLFPRPTDRGPIELRIVGGKLRASTVVSRALSQC